jgi:hypothetical protein
MRVKCKIKESQYWDIILQDGEKAVNNSSNTNLSIETNDGYVITIKLHLIGSYRGCFNGYVRMPNHIHLAEWARKNPSYDDMNFHTELPVEFTYFNASDFTFGWDHMHCYDADLLKSESEQPGQIVSGPVQVLEEARQVIKEFRTKETEIKLSKKRAEINIIQNELMMKICHPRRIALWLEQGFDPFP